MDASDAGHGRWVGGEDEAAPEFRGFRLAAVVAEDFRRLVAREDETVGDGNLPRHYIFGDGPGNVRIIAKRQLGALGPKLTDQDNEQEDARNPASHDFLPAIRSQRRKVL